MQHLLPCLMIMMMPKIIWRLLCCGIHAHALDNDGTTQTNEENLLLYFITEWDFWESISQDCVRRYYAYMTSVANFRFPIVSRPAFLDEKLPMKQSIWKETTTECRPHHEEGPF